MGTCKKAARIGVRVGKDKVTADGRSAARRVKGGVVDAEVSNKPGSKKPSEGISFKRKAKTTPPAPASLTRVTKRSGLLVKAASGIIRGSKTGNAPPATSRLANIIASIVPLAMAVNGFIHGKKGEITPPPTAPFPGATKVSEPVLKAVETDLTAVASYATSTIAQTNATADDGNVEMHDAGPVGGAVVAKSKDEDAAILFDLTIRTRKAGNNIARGTGLVGVGDVEMGGGVVEGVKHQGPRIRGNPHLVPYGRNINEYDPRDPGAGEKHEKYMRAINEDVAVGTFDRPLKNLNRRLYCKSRRADPPNLIEDGTSDDVICGDCGLVFVDVGVLRY